MVQGPTARPHGTRAPMFGPSALVTPANAVTLARLAAAPACVAVVLAKGPSWAALGIWAVLASTDGLDGFVARRHGTTRSGAFLDPLADKVLVVGAMSALVAQHVFWWVPVALITVREGGLVAYRSLLGRRGVSMPASKGAKLKTVVQGLAIAVALLPAYLHRARTASELLWVAVVLTVVTGLQYLLAASRAPAA